MDVNRRFCALRSEAELLREAATPLNEPLSPLIRDRLRAGFAARFCEKLQAKARDWNAFRSWLNPDNLGELSLLQAEDSGEIGCRFATACRAESDAAWEHVFPSAEVPGLPPPLSIADAEFASWQESVRTLQDLLPQIEEQLQKDRDLLCLLAEDLRRSQRLAAFLEKKIAQGRPVREAEKVVRLRESQQSHLLQNIERFKVKWSPEQFAKLDCLRELNNEPANGPANGPTDGPRVLEKQRRPRAPSAAAPSARQRSASPADRSRVGAGKATR